MTAFGLGLAALGRPGYINVGHGADLPSTEPEAMEAHAHRVLDAAYEGGIRYFDAARSYGRAEDFLASWLARRGLQPGEVFVASKWGYTYTAGWRVEADPPEVKDLSVAPSSASSRRLETCSDGGCRSTRSTPRPCQAGSSTTLPS